MPAIFEYRLRVTPDAIDALGHANNTVYLQWMEAAAIAHSTAQGWSTQQYLDRGVAWIARSHSIEYRRPAWLDDEIVVRTWVEDMQRVSSRRQYRIERLLGRSAPHDEVGTPPQRSGAQRELLARAETRWVLIDLEKRRPIRIPPDIVSSFELVDSPAPPPPTL